jgi:hypothetical protein
MEDDHFTKLLKSYQERLEIIMKKGHSVPEFTLASYRAAMAALDLVDYADASPSDTNPSEIPRRRECPRAIVLIFLLLRKLDGSHFQFCPVSRFPSCFFFPNPSLFLTLGTIGTTLAEE